MRRVQTHVRVPVPDWLYGPLRAAAHWRRARHNATTRNLQGDRDIEWSFIAAHLPDGPGEALDFGSGGSQLSLTAAFRGFRVTAFDRQSYPLPYAHPGLRVQLGDILETSLPADHYDLVMNCSTVEHVGLAGRYGASDPRPDGDLEAMAILRSVMKPGGRMLLTVPVGRDAVFRPMCRVYGAERLPRLLEGFTRVHEEYWTKREGNAWVPCDAAEALASETHAGADDPMQNFYCLGLLVLDRPGGDPAP